jgi:hypothetical protein
MLWNDEVQRVIFIDLGRAKVTRKRKSSGRKPYSSKSLSGGLLYGMRSLSRSLESRCVRGSATVAKARISSAADRTFPQRFAFMVKTQTEIWNCIQ